ncbi:MAG: hypothetical protein JWP75_1632 [Frondihabitans sp.]|nr:hypothetical protein [Frondihabitans sp.]
MISIQDVQKSYGTTAILKDVSFDVNDGEVVVLIGPSGAGKSTMLRCINKLETIDGGEIRFDGAVCGPSHHDVRNLRKRVGMVFQNFHLYPHLTAQKNVALAPVLARGLSKREAAERATELLEKVGLGGKLASYPSQLSGGQQQRVAIARALAMDPEVMLFDEPTSSLDPELIGEVQSVIADLAGEGMTMVIVTHGMEFARSIADTVHVMVDGRIIESGSAGSIFSAPTHDRTRSFLKTILG